MNCCYIYTYNTYFKKYYGFYKDLMIKSLETLLMFYEKDINDIYILIDNNIKEENYIELINCINDVNKNRVNIIYKLVDLNITNIFKYPKKNLNRSRINNIGLLKFLIPYLVNCENILYIDCDILFKDNIIKDIYKDFNKEKTLIKMFQCGWNSGLILFNCDVWRKEKKLIQDIINYYNTNQEMNYVDNSVFHWLSRDSKYKNKCIKDSNFKINFPLIEPEGWKELFSIKEYDWHLMNILHVWGSFKRKSKLFYEIYDWIIQTNK